MTDPLLSPAAQLAEVLEVGHPDCRDGLLDLRAALLDLAAHFGELAYRLDRCADCEAKKAARSS